MPGPALVVIDLQSAMLDGVQFPPLHDHEGLLARIGALLARARERGAPVAYVRHTGGDGDPLRPGEPGWPIYPAIAPAPGEPIFDKTIGDAFPETRLAEWLREVEADEVVLMGAQTDECVNATFQGAKARGLSMVVVADGHSTYPNQAGESAAEIIARHNAAFAAAGARVVDAARIL
jgi:nicotinamidase-related amidase